MRHAPALLFLAACGRDPTLLADMGDVDVVVSYSAFEAAGPGATDVYLTPHEECPTFVGDAAVNGQPMEIVEAGRVAMHTYYFIPVSDCHTPHFTLGAPAQRDDGVLTVTLTDDSATWQVGSDDAYAVGYTHDGGGVAPGADLVLRWTGPAVPVHVFAEAWRDDLGVYVPYTVGGDGTLTLSFPEDVGAGPLQLVIEAYVSAPAPTCAGFAACTLSVSAGTVLDLVVE